jgi:hypothetical protein
MSIAGLDPKPLPSPPPRPVVRLILWAHRWLTGAGRALLPAEARVTDLVTGVAGSYALLAIVRRGVPDVLADQTLSSADLAARIGCNADLLHRTMRVLATRGVFRLLPDGRFANSPASHALRTGHPGAAREFVLYFMSRSNLAAWEAIDWTLETGDSAFEHVHGMSVWDWFEQHPDERQTFAAAMTGLTVADAPLIAGLYPFDRIRVLCDVGGGRGLLLSEVLLRHPVLEGILCDAPSVLASARSLLEQRGVVHRVKLEPASFFDRLPAGADAYLMKNILHDWDDETCVRILRVVRAAAGSGARLVVAESLVSRVSRDPFGTGADLQMAIACSRGRERDVDDFHHLFARAGFAPGCVLRSPLIGVIEGVVP